MIDEIVQFPLLNCLDSAPVLVFTWALRYIYTNQASAARNRTSLFLFDRLLYGYAFLPNEKE